MAVGKTGSFTLREGMEREAGMAEMVEMGVEGKGVAKERRMALWIL